MYKTEQNAYKDVYTIWTEQDEYIKMHRIRRHGQQRTNNIEYDNIPST